MFRDRVPEQADTMPWTGSSRLLREQTREKVVYCTRIIAWADEKDQLRFRIGDDGIVILAFAPCPDFMLYYKQY